MTGRLVLLLLLIQLTVAADPSHKSTRGQTSPATTDYLYSVQVVGRQVVGKDVSGDSLWTYPAPSGITCSVVTDVDGDQKNEVVLGTDEQSFGLVILLNNNGSERWRFKTGTTGGYSPDSTYTVVGIRVDDVDTNGVREIISSSDQTSWFSERLCVLSPDGILKAEYWNPGQAGAADNLVVSDLNGDGVSEIIVGGVNKYMGGAFIVYLLEGNNVGGEAPSDGYDRGAVNGSQLWYQHSLPFPSAKIEVIDDVDGDGWRDIRVSLRQDTGHVVLSGRTGDLLSPNSAGVPSMRISCFFVPPDTAIVGMTSIKALSVHNAGTVGLQVSSVKSQTGNFSISPDNFVVGADEDRRVHIMFSPMSAKVYKDTICYIHNSGEIYFMSDFNHDSVGGAPVGYQVLYWGDIEVVSSPSFEGGKALKLKGSVSQGVTVQKQLDIAGDFCVDFYVYATSSGLPNEVKGSVFLDGFGVIFQNASSGSNVVIKTQGGADGYVSADSWHHIRFVASAASRLQRVFADDSLVSIGTQPKSNVFALRLSSGDINPLATDATIYLDKIEVCGMDSDVVSVSGIGITATSGLSTHVGQYSAGLPPKAWTLLSVPYDVQDKSSSVLSSVLTGENAWRLYSFENGSYHDISKSDTAFLLGKAVWLKTLAVNAPYFVQFGSGKVIEDLSYPKSLPPGWSLVGSPFYANQAAWGPINTATGSAGIRVYRYRSDVNPPSWEGPLSPDTAKMQPFGGYAVWNGTGSSAILTVTRDSSSPAAQAEWNQKDGWYARLQIGNANLRIGQHRLVSDRFTLLNYPAPPIAPEGNSQTNQFEHQLWSDIRQTNDPLPLKWEVMIDPKNGHNFQLREVRYLPKDWMIVVQSIPDLSAVDLEPGQCLQIPPEVNDPFTATIIAGPSGVLSSALQPQQFFLAQNYPNPFNSSTAVSFGLPVRSRVHIALYNTLGQLVAELANEEMEPGYYSRVWNAVAATGVYFYRIEAVDVTNSNNRFVQAKKMLLLK